MLNIWEDLVIQAYLGLVNLMGGSEHIGLGWVSWGGDIPRYMSTLHNDWMCNCMCTLIYPVPEYCFFGSRSSSWILGS